MPSARTLASIANKVGPGFLFSVKVPGEITHEREDDPRLQWRCSTPRWPG